MSIARTRAFAALVLLCPVLSHATEAAAEELADVVERITPGIGTVLVYSDAEAALPSGAGSGFFARPDRIVTNFHVIRGAEKIQFQDAEGELHAIEQVGGTDPAYDLAVLIVEDNGRSRSTLELRKDKPRVGSSAYVLGSPKGLHQTLSDGIVSAFREVQEVPTVQITAAISRGSSGSPVFDKDGRVFGVATFKRIDGESLNFAVPIRFVLPLLEKPGRPVPEATRGKVEVDVGFDRPDQLEGQLYSLFARRYLEAHRTGEDRPELRFGRSQGSVGHIDRRVRVFQILSNSEALLKLVGVGRDRLFKITGVKLANMRDGTITRFDRDLVFAQFSTYRYTNVVGAQRTVYAVVALDSETFEKAVEAELADELKQLDEIRAEHREAVKRLKTQEREIADLRRASYDVKRAMEIEQMLRAYRRVRAGRPRVQREVEKLEAELRSLHVSRGDARAFEKELTKLEHERETLRKRSEALESKVRDVERELPRIVDR